MEIDPTSVVGYVAAGNVELGHANWRKAEGWYRRALELEPHNRAAQLNLVVAQEAGGRIAPAFVDAGALLRFDPRDADARSRIDEASCTRRSCTCSGSPQSWRSSRWASEATDAARDLHRSPGLPRTADDVRTTRQRQGDARAPVDVHQADALPKRVDRNHHRHAGRLTRLRSGGAAGPGPAGAALAEALAWSAASAGSPARGFARSSSAGDCGARVVRCACSRSRTGRPSAPGSSLRRCGRRHELTEWSVPVTPDARPDGHDATIVLGGGMHADEEELHPWLLPASRSSAGGPQAGVPLLGVCLGAQLVARAAGGRVVRAPEKEVGWHEVELTEAGESVLSSLPPRLEAFQWHHYTWELPAATELARGRGSRRRTGWASRRGASSSIPRRRALRSSAGSARTRTMSTTSTPFAPRRGSASAAGTASAARSAPRSSARPRGGLATVCC